jgi:outer membrane protein assembly factor BamB
MRVPQTSRQDGSRRRSCSSEATPLPTPWARLFESVPPSVPAQETSCRARWCLAVLMMAAVTVSGWGLGVGTIQGQDDLRALGDVENKFLPAPRNLLQRLTRARQAISAQRYNVAVEELGAILAPDGDDFLDLDVDQDYFITPQNAGGAMPSLKTEAQRIIGAMPTAGRDLYELRYGAAARAELDEAMRADDITRLTEVTRKYFHTRAGYEATLLLGRRHLDEGRPLAAAFCFQRLSDNSQALRLFDPELSLLLATCWLYADAREQAEETLLALKRRQPDAELRVGDSTVRLFRDDRQSVAWLEQTLGRFGSWQLGDQDQWVVFRGDPGRNARTSGGVPLIQYRWRVPTTNDPTDEQLVQDFSRQNIGSSSALLPSLQPLAVRDVVLMRTPRRLFAVDFVTGKRVWEFPWDDSPDELAQQSQDLQTSRSNPSPRMTELTERLWKDAAYGQVSSDGESVFLLSELSFAGTSGVQNFIQQGGFQQFNANWPKSHNKLVSLSLAREGALQWVVGGEDGEDEPRLAGAFFLGVPLPVMGQLYVLAEISGEIRLVVLDPRTGRLQWQQQLAHVDTLTIQSDISRRLAAATPSFADGILVCPTSAGAVVAVDISNRSLLWGFQYPVPMTATNLNRFPGNRGGIRNSSEESWADATVTISEGRVLLTPVESGEMHALDLLTGRPLWNPRKREEGLYVGCIHKNLALVVGKSNLQAIDMRTGEEAWSNPISLEDAQPGGRGFYSDNYYYLPTSDARLLKIDLEEGAIVDQQETRVPLGNLICYRDQILSQGVDWLIAFYQSDPLRSEVAARLEKDPEDRWALARHCELLLQDGKTKEAIETMWTSHELDPEDDVLRTLLVDTYLESLGDDFPTYADRIGDLEPLIDQPAQRMAFLRLLSQGLERSGDLAGAFDAVMRLADQQQDVGPQAFVSSLGNSTLERIDRRWHVGRDRWIQGRIASLLRAAEAAQEDDLRAAWDQQIAARYQEVQGRPGRGELRRFIEQFSSHPEADAARRDYAQILFQDQEWLAAEVQLASLVDRPGSSAAESASELMAQLLDPLRASSEQDFDWPYGRVETEVLSPTDAGPAPAQRPSIIPLRDSAGPWPTGTTLILDGRMNVIQVVDRYGRLTQQIPLQSQRTASIGASATSAQAKALGHLVIVSLPQEILAINLLRSAEETGEAILWRQDVSENILPTSSRGVNNKMLRHPWSHTGVRAVPSDGTQARVPLGHIGPVTRHGVCFQRFRELVCVDPLTGETVWTREGIERGADLFGDEEFLFVVPYDQEEAQVLDAATGEWLGKRPIEKLEKRWATRGRNVLAWREEEDQLFLKLYDVWSQQVLWEERFSNGARGELIGEEEVAVLSPSGELVVVSLTAGRERFRQQLREISNLAYLHVQPSRERYLVLAGFAMNAPQRITLISPNNCTPVLQGQLYSLDPEDGTFQWSRPAEIEQFAVPLLQPVEAPAFVLMRNITYRMNQSRQVGSLLCIDKRDGRLLHLENELSRPTAAYQIVADPGSGQMQVTLGAQSVTHALRLRFTDQPTPPAPPAQTGESASRPSPFSADRIRQWTGMLADAFDHSQIPGVLRRGVEQLEQAADEDGDSP